MLTPIALTSEPRKPSQRFRELRAKIDIPSMLSKAKELQELQDIFSPGKIINNVNIPGTEKGLYKQYWMRKELIQCLDAQPNNALVYIRLDPQNNHDFFKNAIANTKNSKKSATNIFTQCRLTEMEPGTDYGGSTGVHYITSVTDISKKPPETLHIDPLGMPPSQKMEAAYRAAFPGTIIKFSNLVQQKESQFSSILACHLIAVANAYQKSIGQGLIPANNLLQILRLDHRLAKAAEAAEEKALKLLR